VIVRRSNTWRGTARIGGALRWWVLGAACATVVACGPAEGSVFTLDEGDCFDDPGEVEDIVEVPVVPCDEPHDNEVFAAFDLGRDDYPGPAVLQEEAFEGCVDRFDDHVGVEYAASQLLVGALQPSASGWEDGDREVVCFLYSPDGMLTGTMEGAQR